MIEDYILFEFLGLRTYPKQCWINFTPEVKKMQKNGSFKRLFFILEYENR